MTEPEAREGRRAGQGPGGGPVPQIAIALFSLIAILLGLFALYSLWTFWPDAIPNEQAAARPQRVSWFTWHPSLDREFLFFLTVAIAGALGGLIHTIRSFVWYVGNRNLVWSWIPYNLLLPLVGALAGTVFYLVLRAGLFSPSTSVEQASPFGFATVAILAGLFSPQAFEKLRLIATDVFAASPQGEDHTPSDPPERR